MTGTQTPPPENIDAVTADAAALAAGSAERAREAAAAAMTNAQIAAASVAHEAAETIADHTNETEERIAAWESNSATQREELSALKSRLDNHQTETAQTLSKILERLPPPPASPASPNPEPAAVTPPPATAAPPAESKPERRRAHRWI